MKRPSVSFLLGSGFSIPAGLPSVNKINERLSKIDESEIYFHTDKRTFFLNGQLNPNEINGRIERVFLQEFLEFYNNNILINGEQFQYEIFYDFYSDYLNNNKNINEISQFYESFFKKHLENQNCGYCKENLFSDFHTMFNQLLASQFCRSIFFNDGYFDSYPPYDPFIKFITELLKTCDVKVHTLNHDLLFDFFGKKHIDLFENFADGYILEGSPYYKWILDDSEKHIGKMVRFKLEYFADKFDMPLCLYKLHGSVLNTIIHEQDKQTVRVKSDGAIKYEKEVSDSINEQKFETLDGKISPDFLSGTTTKIIAYSEPYYSKLLDHFKENLSNSKLLVVIGYGFQDSGINEILLEKFLSKRGKMVVIDPKKPRSELIDTYNAKHIPKKLDQVTNQDFQKIL